MTCSNASSTVKLWGHEFLSGEKTDLHFQLEMANTQKTAIVTGGSEGIGAGLVKGLSGSWVQRGGEFAKHHQVGRVRGVG